MNVDLAEDQEEDVKLKRVEKKAKASAKPAAKAAPAKGKAKPAAKAAASKAKPKKA
jgi:hypothetical protein